MRHKDWIKYILKLKPSELKKLQEHLARWIPNSALPRMYFNYNIPETNNIKLKWKSKNNIHFYSGKILIKDNEIFLSGSKNVKEGFFKFLSEWLLKTVPIKLEFKLISNDIQIDQEFIDWMRFKFCLEYNNPNNFTLN